jgi:hypothetical protein
MHRLLACRGRMMLALHQQRYTSELLAECGVGDAEPASTPMRPEVELRRLQPDDLPLGPDLPCSKVLGKVQFLASCTRPDITKAGNALAQHMADIW